MREADPGRPARMPVSDHLEELRKKIFLSLTVFALAIAASIFLTPLIFGGFLSPLEGTGIKLYSYTPYEKLLSYIKICCAAAFAISLPFIAAIAASFVLPGLLPKERRLFPVLCIASVLFFLAGAFVSVRFLSGRLLLFLHSFASGDGIPQLWSFGEYCSLVLNAAFAGGLVLQAPFVLAALVKAGILRTETLKRYRRHAVLATAVVSAVLSPGPDVLLQLMFGIVLYLSYETAVLFGKIFERRRERSHRTDTRPSEPESAESGN